MAQARPILTWGPVFVLCAFYAYSLKFGYIWDDPGEVTKDFAGANESISRHFRPLYYYSFALSNAVFDTPFPHRLINFLLMALAVFLAGKVARKFSLSFAPLLVLAIFLHPTFVYPITWISQRNDLLLLVFLLLSILNLDKTRGLIYLILSDASKMPFVFQNVWYAVIQWRVNRNRTLAIVSLAVLPPIIFSGYFFYADYSSEATSSLTFFSGDGLQVLLTVAAARMAKVAESWTLILIPFPGYFQSGPVALIFAVSAMYVAAWAVIGRNLITQIRSRRNSYKFLFLGIFMSMPFIFNSDMRIFGPAIPFIFFGIFALTDNARSVGIALAVIVGLNAGGSVLNYRLSDSGVYNTTTNVDYQQCGSYELSFPTERWRCSRSNITRDIVDRLNALLN